MSYSNTEIKEIINALEKLSLPSNNSIPVLIPGGEHTNFGVEHKQVQFDQIILMAYEIENNGNDMPERFRMNIESKFRNNCIVLSYPFSDEAAVKNAIADLATYFKTQINTDHVIQKSANPRVESMGFYLFVTIVSNYYN